MRTDKCRETWLGWVSEEQALLAATTLGLGRARRGCGGGRARPREWIFVIFLTVFIFVPEELLSR